MGSWCCQVCVSWEVGILMEEIVQVFLIEEGVEMVNQVVEVEVLEVLEVVVVEVLEGEEVIVEARVELLGKGNML